MGQLPGFDADSAASAGTVATTILRREAVGLGEFEKSPILLSPPLFEAGALEANERFFSLRRRSDRG